MKTFRHSRVGIILGAAIFALPTMLSALIDLNKWPPAHQKVLFDTDISMDVDDVGALAMVHKFADDCAADILAIGVSMPQKDLLANIVKCVDAIDTYYGRPNIPIGVVKRDWGTATVNSMYVGHFSGTVGPNDIDTSQVPEGCVLYEQVLGAQPDTSVTIIITGYPTNLAQLMQRAGGVALVRRKVKMVVQMGGWNEECCGGKEGNLQLNPAATRLLVDSLPCPIVYSGFQEGAFINTGSGFKIHPTSSPVNYCWSTFGFSRSSWDPIAVLFAFRGAGAAAAPYFTTYTHGVQTYNAADGSNKWSAADVPGKAQGFIKLASGADTRIQMTIDSLFALPPAPGKCSNQTRFKFTEDATPDAQKTIRICGGTVSVGKVNAGLLELFDWAGRLCLRTRIINGKAELNGMAGTGAFIYRIGQKGMIVASGRLLTR